METSLTDRYIVLFLSMLKKEEVNMLEPCRFLNCLDRILVSKVGEVYDVSVYFLLMTVDFW